MRNLCRWLFALSLAAPPALACELVLSGHRDASEKLRVALPAAAPRFEIRFAHSVLGTQVVDRYEVRGQTHGQAARVHLVAEQFEGEGYGLPHLAAAGESLIRDGAVSTLHLDRLVHPLVVRPIATQKMTLQIGSREWLLADLGAGAIEFSARDCR